MVSGMTVRIRPLPNNPSFSAIAPIAAVPISFSAIADARPVTAIAIDAPSAFIPSASKKRPAVAPSVIFLFLRVFSYISEWVEFSAPAFIEFSKEFYILQPECMQSGSDNTQNSVKAMSEYEHKYCSYCCKADLRMIRPNHLECNIIYRACYVDRRQSYCYNTSV